jgi:hypothetical protein
MWTVHARLYEGWICISWFDKISWQSFVCFLIFYIFSRISKVSGLSITERHYLCKCTFGASNWYRISFRWSTPRVSVPSANIHDLRLWMCVPIWKIFLLIVCYLNLDIVYSINRHRYFTFFKTSAVVSLSYISSLPTVKQRWRHQGD